MFNSKVKTLVFLMTFLSISAIPISEINTVVESKETRVVGWLTENLVGPLYDVI